MASRTITLRRPFLWHDQMVSEITLREPNAAEVLRIGEPFELVNVKGELVPVDVPGVVSQYADACIEHVGGRAVLKMLGVEDARQIRETICGFFYPGLVAPPATASPSSSST